MALGVGAAVSLGSGIAWADDGTGGGSESGGSVAAGGSTAGSATSGGGSSAGAAVKAPKSGSTPTDDTKETAESPTDAKTGGSGATGTDGSSSSHKRKPAAAKAAKKEAAEAPKSSVTSRPARNDDDGDGTGVSASRAVKATPVAVAASVASASVPAAQVKPAAPVVAQATGSVAGAVAESSLLGGVPGNPLVNSPILWVAAAASRRGFGGGSDVPEEGASLAAAAAASAAGAGAVPNNPPTATYTAGKPSTTTGVVTGTVKGVDVDKDALMYSAPAATSKGTVVISATNGKFTYTPSVNARQTAATSLDPADKLDSFDVTVTDALGATGTVTVQVAIDPNNKPVEGVHVVNAPNDTTGVVTGAVKVTDLDKDKLTYTTVATTAKGKVTLNASTGAFTYTPTQAARQAAAGSDVAAKQDSFTVTVKDAQGASITTVVNVAVSPNQAPVIAPVTLNDPAPANGAITGTVNATDPEGGLLKYAVGATATKSKITVDANTGALTYTPTAAARHAASLTVGAITSDSFTVSVTDAKGAVTTQLVTVPISPFNATPTSSVPAGKTTINSGVVTGTIKTADADKDKLNFSASTLTTPKGTFTVNPTTGAYTYTPNQAARLASGSAPIGDPATSDSISVTISDGHTDGTITQILTVPVAPNTAPTSPSATVNAPNPTTGVVTGTVKAVDLVDKDALTYTVPGSTGRGAVTINAKTGAFTYTPTQAARQAAADGVAGDAAQSDSFTVTITDARGASITQGVTVAVSPNKAPIDAVINNQSTNPSTGVVTGTVTA
ncbi:MAG: Ig-like domain-containing protein, partial [Mycobacterium sp.]